MPHTHHRYETFLPVHLPGFNVWDMVFLCIVSATLAFLAWGALQLAVPYNVGAPLPLTLDPHALPYYAACSVLRIFIGILCSLFFTLVLGTLAAKSPKAEKIILPMIDVFQSIPILGFLSFSVVMFIQWFPGSLLGLQCAAVFALFTSQAWNMIFSLYSSLKTTPADLKEACQMYQLSAWRQFWQLELPFALPALIWNTMASMSAAWFFVVASEAVCVHAQTIYLPGIGSYIALAIHAANTTALIYAVLTMLVVITLYDCILFRPLLAWSNRFQVNAYPTETNHPWVLKAMQRARFLQRLGAILIPVQEVFLNLFPKKHPRSQQTSWSWSWPAAWSGLGLVIYWSIPFLSALSLLYLHQWFESQHIGFHEIRDVFWLGLITLFKVMVLLVLASIVWVPIGVWIGLRPTVTRWVQPLLQFLAAFPSNLFFPFVTMMIITHHLNPNIWTAPLMILGTQWYLLFNIIAGTTLIPQELQFAAMNYQLKGIIRWRRFLWPALMPHYVTGAIAAVGGCWNASIVSEVVTWGPHTVISRGLGSYIVHASDQGDFPRLALGIAMMSLIVIVVNRVFWQKLYKHAQEYTFDG